MALKLYRLLAGIHIQDEFTKDADGKLIQARDADDKPVTERGKPVYEKAPMTYRADSNNVVESHKDLITILPNKFQLIGPSKRKMSDEEVKAWGIKDDPKKTAVKTQDDEPEDDGLEKMTVADLHELVERDEIDIGNATRKDDIIKAIRAAR